MINTIQNRLKDALYDSTRAILDHLGMRQVPIVFSHESGLEHKNTYCVIQIIERKRAGRVQDTTASPLDQDSKNVYTNYYTLCAQFTFVGEQSDDVMAEFDDSVFSSRQCLDYWQMRQLGAVKQGNSRYTPQLRDTKWIPSYSIDLDLSYAVQSFEDIDWIESFNVKDDYGFDPWASP